MSSPRTPTPFDDLGNSGAPVPDAKYTQPLPPPFQNDLNRRAGSLLSGLQSGAATPPNTNDDPNAIFPPPVTPPTFTPPASTSPTSTPPVVASPLTAQPSANLPSSPTARLKALPMPTLLGLAGVGGALLVVLIPALMRRVIPTVPMKTMPTTVAVEPRGAAPAAVPTTIPPTTVEVVSPSTEDTKIGVAGKEKVGQDTAGDDLSTPSMNTREPLDADGSASNTSVESGSLIEADGQETSPDSAQANDVAIERDQKGLKPEPVAATRTERTTRSRRSVTRARYEISPPSDWKQRQSGRRSIWQGPRGAQLLVETSDEVGASPRRDWERLDKALAKKYGERYRSLGIRETTLAGLPAAAWEFELRSKNGSTTRKLDIAVHHRGRGYAVMGSAPVESFEEMRPQLESAINSFRLRTNNASESATNDEESTTSSSSRADVSRRDEDADSLGY